MLPVAQERFGFLPAFAFWPSSSASSSFPRLKAGPWKPSSAIGIVAGTIRCKARGKRNRELSRTGAEFRKRRPGRWPRLAAFPAGSYRRATIASDSRRRPPISSARTHARRHVCLKSPPTCPPRRYGRPPSHSARDYLPYGLYGLYNSDRLEPVFGRWPHGSGSGCARLGGGRSAQ